MMEVYAVAQADITELLNMYNKLWVETYQGIQPEATEEYLKRTAKDRTYGDGLKRQLQKVKDAAKDPDQFLYQVVKEQGKIVGFIYAFRTEKAIELDRLYVAKEFQGKMVAVMLMKKFLEWSDGGDVRLSVVTGNERARHFYEKYGFHVVPESNHIYPNGVMEVFDMVRTGEKS